MIEASEYIEQIVQSIDNSLFAVYDVATNRSYISDTKWARVGKIVTDSLNREFRITEISYDSYVIAEPLSGGVEVLEGSCTIPNPFYITGTKMATNSEWTLADSNLENKLPLIWLLEVISETGYGRDSSLERSIEVRLFFLDETDPQQYYTKDHREQVVKPMQKLMKMFLDIIEADRQYQPIESYRFKTFSRFGVEQDTGMVENILDANLSGVALEFTLTRYKSKNC